MDRAWGGCGIAVGLQRLLEEKWERTRAIDSEKTN
jgi:hypothetical protein